MFKPWIAACMSGVVALFLGSAPPAAAQVSDEHFLCARDAEESVYTVQRNNRKFFHDAFSVMFAAPRGEAAEYLSAYYGVDHARAVKIMQLTMSYFEAEGERQVAQERGLAVAEGTLVGVKAASDLTLVIYGLYNPIAAIKDATTSKVMATSAAALALASAYAITKTDLILREITLRLEGKDPGTDTGYKSAAKTNDAIGTALNAVGLANWPKKVSEAFGMGLTAFTDPNLSGFGKTLAKSMRDGGSDMFDAIVGGIETCGRPQQQAERDMPEPFQLADPTAAVEPAFDVIGAWHRRGTCHGAPLRIAGTSPARITSVSSAFQCSGGYRFSWHSTSPPIWVEPDRLKFRYERTQEWQSGDGVRREHDTGDATLRFGRADNGGVWLTPDGESGEDGFGINKD